MMVFRTPRSSGSARRRKKLIIGCCNCFAGGVFFSVCLLDLLPSVRNKMTRALLEINVSTTFPLGESIAAVGFIMMVVSEILVHVLGKGSWLMDHHHDHDEELLENDEVRPLINDEQPQGYGSGKGNTVNIPRSLSVVASDNIVNANCIENPNERGPDSRPCSPGIDDDNVVFEGNFTPRLRRSRSIRSIASVNTVTHSSFRMYILIMALSLHSLFEGLSVGLITDVDTLIQLLIALLLHKSIISFALGVKLVDGGLKVVTIVKGIILFAAMAPIGVGVGLAVLNSFSRVASLFCSGILQGLATGSFFYVTFFEILPEEFTMQSHNKGSKVLFVIIGFLIIAGMCYYENQFHMIKKVMPHVGGPTTPPH